MASSSATCAASAFASASRRSSRFRSLSFAAALSCSPFVASESRYAASSTLVFSSSITLSRRFALASSSSCASTALVASATGEDRLNSPGDIPGPGCGAPKTIGGVGAPNVNANDGAANDDDDDDDAAAAGAPNATGGGASAAPPPNDNAAGAGGSSFASASAPAPAPVSHELSGDASAASTNIRGEPPSHRFFAAVSGVVTGRVPRRVSTHAGVAPPGMGFGFGSTPAPTPTPPRVGSGVASTDEDDGDPGSSAGGEVGENAPELDGIFDALSRATAFGVAPGRRGKCFSCDQPNRARSAELCSLCGRRRGAGREGRRRR